MRDTIYIVAALMSAACAPAFAAPVTFSATGTNAASITPTRDAFRADLGGGVVAGANGLFTDGTNSRREINWDGVPAQFTDPNVLPATFFNVNSPRGAVLSTGGTGFEVSSNPADSLGGQPAPANFGNINASYSTTFAPFSPTRLFTSIGSNVYDVHFFVPGTNTPATVRGFGAVFSDVDLPNVTSIQYFDANDVSLGTFFAPATLGTATFSFLGVSFNAGEQIGRVRITQGTAALGPNDAPTQTIAPPVDVVVADDFIYSDPAVPEPASLALLATGAAALLVRRRK